MSKPVVVREADGTFSVRGLPQEALEGLIVAIGVADGDLMTNKEYIGAHDLLEEIEKVLPPERIAYVHSQRHLDDAQAERSGGA